MQSYQPVIAQPGSGGDLITRLSPENAGGSNYVVKREWRRTMDAETRREGHVKFAPDSDLTPDAQYSVPSGETVTLVHFARRANGATAVIVGTATRLYRYFSFEDGEVYENGTYEPDVYQDLSGTWLEIGSGFTADAQRWEARNVAGQTVFNNGVDLPVVYDLGWLAVRPLRELREQGIAFAGTIEEFNGMLVLGDIAELNDEATLVEVMTGRLVSAGSQTGYTVTATSSTFTSDDVGKTILFSTGEFAKIVTYSSPTVVATDTFQTVGTGPFRIATMYGTISDDDMYSRVQYRLMCSDVGDANDFALGIHGSGTAGSNVLTITRPTFSLEVGDEITIPGAGVAGSALSTTIYAVNGYRTEFTLADDIVTTFSGELVQWTESLQSMASSFDLQDDGSGIVRLSELQGRLIVFKETAILVGQFTGDAASLMTFQKVYGGEFTLAWKWMLAKINGEQLLYAGSDSFYTFDLATLRPKVHPKLLLCQDIFYNEAVDGADVDECWALDNVLTNEIWFVFPSDSDDKALCYDYQFNTCSTITQEYTAGASVNKPVAGVQIGVGEDWCVLGSTDGMLFQYGLTNLSDGVFQRDGVNYDSRIKSGLFAEPSQFNEVDLRSYVIYFSGFSTTPINVKLYGCRNAHETPSQLFSRNIASPTFKNLIPTYFRKNYYQDEVTVTEAATNAALVRRVLEFATTESRSTIRNASS